LIAAAPDLLAALRRIHDCCDDSIIQEIASAAIAKAEDQPCKWA
jgi:hypothetical protein